MANLQIEKTPLSTNQQLELIEETNKIMRELKNIKDRGERDTPEFGVKKELLEGKLALLWHYYCPPLESWDGIFDNIHMYRYVTPEKLRYVFFLGITAESVKKYLIEGQPIPIEFHFRKTKKSKKSKSSKKVKSKSQ